jgi:hypothetical protein
MKDGLRPGIVPGGSVIERTNAWLHCYRGLAMRWAYYPFMYVGLVYLSFIHLALQRFETASSFFAIVSECRRAADARTPRDVPWRLVLRACP